MGSTLASLRSIVHALRGWPTPFAATINSRERPFGGDGQPADPAVLESCALVARQVIEFATLKRGAK
jgi:FMN reductase